MDFLTLARTLRNKCAGMGGSSGLPATVISQTGDLGNLVDWVREAWVDLQLARPDWLFMRDEFTGAALAGERVVTTAASAAEWYSDTFRCYRTADGSNAEQFITMWEYDALRDTYMFGQQTPGLPAVFSFRPRDKAILLGPLPDAPVTVTGEYRRAPQVFAADADTPTGLPVQYHMLIVFRAMTKFAGNMAAPEILVDAANQSEVLMDSLVRDWTPSISSAGSLA